MGFSYSIGNRRITPSLHSLEAILHAEQLANHRTTFIEVMNHVQDKHSRLSLRGASRPAFAETVIVVEFIGSTPFGRERRICNHCIELHIIECVPFKRIAILYF